MSRLNDLTELQSARIAGYLGIAQKAGKVAAGDNLAKEAMLKGRAFLLVLAKDIAQPLRDELTALAEAQEIPVLDWPNKIDLGLIVGKSRRGALALLDSGFAAAIEKVISSNQAE